MYIFIFSSKAFISLAWSSQQGTRLCVTHLKLIRERERDPFLIVWPMAVAE